MSQLKVESGGTFPQRKHDRVLAVGTLSKPNLQPIQDRVLVRRFPEGRVSDGGIHIPDVGREKALKGLVIAVGPGKEDGDGVLWKTQLKPGQVVLFTKSVDMPYGDLLHDGDYIMMREADVLGVLEGEPIPQEFLD